MSQSGGKLYIGRTQHTDNQIRFEIILSDTKSPFCDLVWQPVPGLTNLPFSELERRESWNHLRCWTKSDETWLEQLCPRESERLNDRNVWKPFGWREAEALLWLLPTSMPSPGNKCPPFWECPSPPPGLISVGKRRRSQSHWAPPWHTYARLSFHRVNLWSPKCARFQDCEDIQTQSSTLRRASIGLCSLFCHNVCP